MFPVRRAEFSDDVNLSSIAEALSKTLSLTASMAKNEVWCVKPKDGSLDEYQREVVARWLHNRQWAIFLVIREMVHMQGRR